MDALTYLIIIALIYISLFLLDRFYKSCAHYPYMKFLKGTGFEIKFLQIRWETSAFNRTLLRWGTSHSTFLNVWFSLGLNVTLIFLPIACTLLILTTYQTFFMQSKLDSSNKIMIPIIPGVNLPSSELGYYSLTIIISSVFHELGHALTAVKDDVHLMNVGVNVLLILPVAYVSLNSEDVSKLNPKRALKIFCAGVWHNIVLSFIAFLIYLILPYLFLPLYDTDVGVTIKELLNSPLSGNNGLAVGDKIFRINDCNIKNFNDWTDCIHKNRLTKPGFCVPAEFISTFDETVFKHTSTDDYNCCNDNRHSSICFEYLENNNGILEIPPHSCLPARKVIEASKNFCNISTTCPNNSHCIKPMLRDKGNLLKIQTSSRDVIYLGLSDDLYVTVKVTDYAPKYNFLSLNIPDMIEKFFKYIIVFSLGLGVVNVIPCIAMDGHFISNALLQLFLSDKIENQKLYSTITLLVPVCGTLLFSSLVLHTIFIYISPT